MYNADISWVDRVAINDLSYVGWLYSRRYRYAYRYQTWMIWSQQLFCTTSVSCIRHESLCVDLRLWLWHPQGMDIQTHKVWVRYGSNMLAFLRLHPHFIPPFHLQIDTYFSVRGAPILCLGIITRTQIAKKTNLKYLYTKPLGFKQSTFVQPDNTTTKNRRQKLTSKVVDCPTTFVCSRNWLL